MESQKLLIAITLSLDVICMLIYTYYRYTRSDEKDVEKKYYMEVDNIYKPTLDDYNETLESIRKCNFYPDGEFWKQHNKRKIFHWVLKFTKRK